MPNVSSIIDSIHQKKVDFKHLNDRHPNVVVLSRKLFNLCISQKITMINDPNDFHIQGLKVIEATNLKDHEHFVCLQ